jgi:hypothetical protein
MPSDRTPGSTSSAANYRGSSVSVMRGDGVIAGMRARFAVGPYAFGFLFVVANPVRAQSLPVPTVPPLPGPPIPEFRVDSTPPSPGAGATNSTPAGTSNTFDAMLRDPPPSGREALLRSRFHESWYGWQTLAVDAAAVAILLTGAATFAGAASGPSVRLSGSPPSLPIALITTSSGVYAVGPSVVHLAHGHIWRAVASIGLRLVIPLAGFAVGSISSSAVNPRANALANGAVGGLVGGAAASATDAAALGWDRWYGGAGGPVLLSARASF